MGSSISYDEFVIADSLRTLGAKTIVSGRLRLQCLRTIHLSWADPSLQDIMMGHRDQDSLRIRQCALGGCFVDWLASTDEFPQHVTNVKIHFGISTLPARQLSRWIGSLSIPGQVRCFEFRTTWQNLDGSNLQGSKSDQWELISEAVRFLSHACVEFPLGENEGTLHGWIALHSCLPNRVLMTAPVHEPHPFSFDRLQQNQLEALESLVDTYECLDVEDIQAVQAWLDGEREMPQVTAERAFYTIFGSRRMDSPFTEQEAKEAWCGLQTHQRCHFENVVHMIRAWRRHR